MKYLCLAYYDAKRFDTLSKTELEAIVSECHPHDEALRKSGHLLAVASLQHRTATTLRPRNGKTSVIDGPFVETKERIGAFFIIEAKDLTEVKDLTAAIRVGSKQLAAQLGERVGWDVEVQPTDMYEQP